MNKVSKLALAVSVGLYGSVSVAAVEDAGSLDMGGIQVTPSVVAGVGYDDNVFRDGTTGSALKEQGSTVYTLAPSVEFKAEAGLSSYALTLDALRKQFASEDEHDFTNYKAALDLNHEFNSRNRVLFAGSFGVAHDEGSALNGAADKSAPEYKQKLAALTYGFGSKEAIARIDLFADYDAKDYDKTRGVEEGQDRTSKGFGATVYYKLMPKTDLLFEAKKRDLSYDKQDDAGYDITSYLLGLSWEATAKTSGYVKVGQRNRSSDFANVKDEDFNGWEVGVSYLPLEHSLIQLSSGRDYGLESENPTDADFTKGTNTALTWKHDWTSKVSTNLGYSYTDDDVETANGVTTKERTVKTFTAGVSWMAARNLTVSLDWENTKRDEKEKQLNVGEDDYKRNVYMLKAELAL